MATKDQTKERRVLNIDRNQFLIIQKYCFEHDLRMHKWAGNMLVGIINNTLAKKQIVGGNTNNE